MDFLIKENSADGTVVGAIPAGAFVRLLSSDRNDNKTPAFTVGVDNLIRVNDSSELDYERLFADRTYQFLVAGAGADSVITIEVENDPDEQFLGTVADDVLRSGWGQATLRGFDGNDQLTGNFENDTLIGGAGIDLLMGRTGNDLYVFDTPIRTGVDTVVDFINGGREFDKIGLDKDVFTRLKTQKFSFNVVQGQRAARTSNALFTYNSKSGALFYNANGRALGFGSNGGKFAQFSEEVRLSAQDFLVLD